MRTLHCDICNSTMENTPFHETLLLPVKHTLLATGGCPTIVLASILQVKVAEIDVCQDCINAIGVQVSKYKNHLKTLAEGAPTWLE